MATAAPQSVELVLDTGFTGYLTLPPESISQLELTSVGQRTFELANGELFVLPGLPWVCVLARPSERCSGAAIRQRPAAGHGPALG